MNEFYRIFYLSEYIQNNIESTCNQSETIHEIFDTFLVLFVEFHVYFTYMHMSFGHHISNAQGPSVVTW
jgi:hypothetical protein